MAKKFNIGDRVVTHRGPATVLNKGSMANSYTLRLDSGEEGSFWAQYMKPEGQAPVKKGKTVFKLRYRGSDLFYAPNYRRLESGMRGGHMFPSRKKLDEFLHFIRDGVTCLRGEEEFTVTPDSFEVVKFRLLDGNLEEVI